MRLLALSFLLLLDGCIIREIHHYPQQDLHWSGEGGQPTAVGAPGMVVASEAPPAARAEDPGEPPEGGCWNWTDGFWHWNGFEWLWVDGRWSQCMDGYAWVQPSYEIVGDDCYYVPGYWDPTSQLPSNTVVVYDHRGHRAPTVHVPPRGDDYGHHRPDGSIVHDHRHHGSIGQPDGDSPQPWLGTGLTAPADVFVGPVTPTSPPPTSDPGRPSIAAGDAPSGQVVAPVPPSHAEPAQPSTSRPAPAFVGPSSRPSAGGWSGPTAATRGTQVGSPTPTRSAPSYGASRPSYTPSSPSYASPNRASSPSYASPSRASSPSYASPSRASSPSYASPSRASSPSYASPSRSSSSSSASHDRRR